MPDYIIRYVKSDFNKLAIALFVYEVIFQVGSAIVITSGTSFFHNEYFAMILCSGLALFSTFLILGKPQKTERERAVFSSLKYLLYLFLLYGVQLCTNVITWPIIEFFQNHGYSLNYAQEAASGGTYTDPLMIAYTVVFAPLFEELLLRYFVFNDLRKFGKVFAVFTQALLFALIHANIVQIPTAFFIGILFGILRERYGLRASLLLHMSNNGLAIIFNNYVSENMLLAGIYQFLLIGGVSVLFVWVFLSLGKLTESLQAERSFTYMLRYFFTSACMLIVIASFVALTFTNLG